MVNAHHLPLISNKICDRVSDIANRLPLLASQLISQVGEARFLRQIVQEAVSTGYSELILKANVSQGRLLHGVQTQTSSPRVFGGSPPTSL